MAKPDDTAKGPGGWRRLWLAPWARFGLVGIFNTVVGYTLMFGLYNLAGWGYWTVSFFAYALISVLSFVLNKHFTFRSQGNTTLQAVRFFINIAIVYFLAYGIAQKATEAALSRMSEIWRDNFALGVGSVLFVVFNYLGQSRWVFGNLNHRN
ncbi:MAG: GtrA family protein [Proteobacteria bacterium]|nr:GtrA family protein [Cystobacterineae bacterium]MCL2315159.1 GtrA family protein [Pseudomonadota bacterium]